MKTVLLVLCLTVALACDSGKRKEEDQKMMMVQDESAIRSLFVNLHADLKKLYNGKVGDVDSIFARYYLDDMYYVTPWGTSETLDSTKSRLKANVPRILDYENSIENLTVKVYGDGAYAFFVLRQGYSIDGFKLDEYLPTTAVLERMNGTWKIVHLQRTTDRETMQQYLTMQQQSAPQSAQKK